MVGIAGAGARYSAAMTGRDVVVDLALFLVLVLVLWGYVAAVT